MTELDISIIAINYNDPINCSLAVASLERVLEQSQCTCEVILVDDGSDAPLHRIIDIPPEIQYTYHPRTETSCRSAARNVGAKQARGRYLIFVDGDGIVSSDIADQYHHQFHQYPNDIFAVGAALQYPIPPELNQFFQVPNNITAHDYIDRLFERTIVDDMREVLCEDQYLDQQFRKLHTKWALTYGCNIAISAEGFHDIGGWDENMKGWGAEDIEFAYRVSQHPKGRYYNLCTEAKYFKPTDHYKGTEEYLNNVHNMQYCYLKHRDPIWMDAMMFNNELLFDQYPIFETYSDFVRAFRNFEQKSIIYESTRNDISCSYKL